MNTPVRSILDEILEHKREEIAQARTVRSVAELKKAVKDAPAHRSLIGALEANASGIIAEIKRRSPSKGEFKAELDVQALAKAYERGGAAALSILTDARYFGMEPRELSMIRSQTSLPILRKDFIIDPYQVYESRVLGADALLLIVGAIPDYELTDLYNLALGIGLEVLVEVHTEEQFEVALNIGARLVGINSRDLRTYLTDLTLVERLAKLALDRLRNVTLVAESGLSQAAELQRLRGLGVQGFLIGETLLKADDPAAKLRELTVSGLGGSEGGQDD